MTRASWIVHAVQAGWFALISVVLLAGPPLQGLEMRLGWDAIVYTRAAQTLLAGGDPWTAQVFGIVFAAPPPSLLPYLPFVWLPDIAIAAAWVAIGAASSIYAIRKLDLPWWWLLFPPLIFGVAAGSSAPLVLALLVRGGVIADAAAITTRIYATLPLLILSRWRGLLTGVVVVVVTAPFLGLAFFAADLPRISELLVEQADGGLSATVQPYLAIVAAVSLVALGRRRAAWLIVPALWPNTQLYYASIALPALADLPLVALALASPFLPGLIALGLAAQAVVFRITRPRERAWRTWLEPATSSGPATQVPPATPAPPPSASPD